MYTSDVDQNGVLINPLVRNIDSQSKFFSDQFTTAQALFQGLSKYNNDFMYPFLISAGYFKNVEMSRLSGNSPVENFNSYMGLLDFNMDILTRYLSGSLNALGDYNNRELKEYLISWYNTIFNLEGDKLDDFIDRQSTMISNLTKLLPQAIEDIEPEYGFHFERGNNPVLAETDRFIVYKIVPSDNSIKTDDAMKPVFIIPPFVLGSNILAFLPQENKSYVHSFANQGTPTYIRIMKDIETTPEFQIMTLEEEALDTRYFCEKIKAAHGKQITLNGYCQGGYSALCILLSGELDDFVDAFISCVAPMDGTRSQGLGKFLKKLPPRFNDLIYGTKTLSSGNRVADGNLMGWVYKLKSIEAEAPMVSFFRDLAMVTGKDKKPVKISKTAAALNYWLKNERTDLPLSVTEMSFASYNIPVTDDGTLPVTIFGRKLNFKRIAEKKIPWLICYGENDDLVEKETALAPLDYVDAEVTAFPKGHVAIATSWSNPESACALHTRFGKNKCRGPVKFHLDLDKALDDRVKPGEAPRETPLSGTWETVIDPKGVTSGEADTSDKTAALDKTEATDKTAALDKTEATDKTAALDKTEATDKAEALDKITAPDKATDKSAKHEKTSKKKPA